MRSGIFPIKEMQGKGCSRMLASHPSDLAKRLKILTPKQMLQRLPIALAQIKAVKHSKIYWIKPEKSCIFCIEQKKLLKKHIKISWIE